MRSITKFIEKKLKLKVNKEKSAVDLPSKRKFLGFSVYRDTLGKTRIIISKQTKDKFCKKIIELTQRSKSQEMEKRIDKISVYLVGWFAYFKIADIKTFLTKEEERLRRRLRMCVWKQWKRVRTRYKNLKRLGLWHKDALKYANTRKGYWHISNSPILSKTLTNKYFEDMGLICLLNLYRRFV